MAAKNWLVKIIGGENNGKEFIILNSSYENAVEEVFEDNNLSLFNMSTERQALFLQYGIVNKREAIRRIAEWNAEINTLATKLSVLRTSPDIGHNSAMLEVYRIQRSLETASSRIKLLTTLLERAENDN
jgi:hypothetical protein